MTQAQTNGIDTTKLNRFVAEIERVDEELLSERMSYAARCRPIQERKKDWKQRAADDGIPAKALNTMLRERVHLRAIAKLNSGVEDVDERAFLEEMREKLMPVADLPLFGAAIDEQARKAGVGEKQSAAKPAQEADAGAPKTGRRLRRGKPGESVTEDALPTAPSDGPSDSEADLRPRHLREADEKRAAENAAAIERGIRQLN